MVKLLLMAALLAWAGLYLSSYGALVCAAVSHEQPDATGLPPLPAGFVLDGRDVLNCTYFTGASIYRRQLVYAPGGIAGAAICPRLVYLGSRT